MMIRGVCQEFSHPKTLKPRNLRGGSRPAINSRDLREEPECCINKCNVRDAGGHLVQANYIHKFECFDWQGNCHCDGSSQSSFEGWLSACSQNGWGNNYNCGDWAAGIYYCEQGTYAKYPCPEYQRHGQIGPGSGMGGF